MKQIFRTLALLGIVASLFCANSSYAHRKEPIPGTINRYIHYLTREELNESIVKAQPYLGGAFGPLLSATVVADQTALQGGTGIYPSGDWVRIENPSAPRIDPNIARQNEAERLANLARVEQTQQITANEARRVQATAKYAATSERAALERAAGAERKAAEDAARAIELAAEAARAEATLEEGRQKVQSIEDASKARSAKYKALMETWCFPGETLIAVAGGFTKPIASIQVGEFVLSCSPESQICEYRKVLRVFKSVADRLVVLSYDGLEVRATQNHQFYVAGMGWVEAGQLEIGSHLLKSFGEEISLDAKVDEEGTFEVYNLEVEGNHTYYACDVLVHNCNPNVAVAVVGAIASDAFVGAEIGAFAGPVFMVAGGIVAGVAGLALGETVNSAMNAAEGEADSTEVAQSEGGYIPRDELGNVLPLSRDAHGVPMPLSEVEHTEIGGRSGRKGEYRQTRQWDADSNEIKTTDWTDHGRKGHSNPHDHFAEPNPSGGTSQRGDAKPSEITIPRK